MKNNVALIIDVPCFKCLFWDEKKESHLNCIPGECVALTDWILKQVDDNSQDTVVVVDNIHRRVNTHVT